MENPRGTEKQANSVSCMVISGGGRAHLFSDRPRLTVCLFSILHPLVMHRSALASSSSDSSGSDSESSSDSDSDSDSDHTATKTKAPAKAQSHVKKKGASSDSSGMSSSKCSTL